MRQDRALGPKHIALSIGLFVFLAGAGIVLRPLLGDATTTTVIAAAAAIVVAVLLWAYRGLSQVLPNYFRKVYQQVDSRISIDRAIQPTRPLPTMGGVAILPDFAVLVVNEILNHKPKTIVELGSGTSTLLSGYCLQKLGRGRVHSFDHLERFARATADNVHAHGLDDFATVTHAKLTPVTVDGTQYNWYDTAELNRIKPIDMLIVDGPPAELGHHARYPALPLLADALSDNAVVILDDAARPDDRATIHRWLKKFTWFEHDVIPTEKGAAVLRRRSA